MPELAIRIQVLHVGVHDIGRFDGFAGLERLVDCLAGPEILDANPTEGLAFARFHVLIFDDDAGVTIDDDSQS